MPVGVVNGVSDSVKHQAAGLKPIVSRMGNDSGARLTIRLLAVSRRVHRPRRAPVILAFSIEYVFYCVWDNPHDFSNALSLNSTK